MLRASLSLCRAAAASELPSTPFEALGLALPDDNNRYTTLDIKAAYKKTAKRVHPDVPGGCQRRFVLAQRAADILEGNPNDTRSWIGSVEFPASGSEAKPAPSSATSSASAADLKPTPPKPHTQQHGSQQYHSSQQHNAHHTTSHKYTSYHHQQSAHARSDTPPQQPDHLHQYRHSDNRHFVAEAAAAYYAWRDGRLRQHVTAEYARRRRCSSARKAERLKKPKTHRPERDVAYPESNLPMYGDSGASYDLVVNGNAAACYTLITCGVVLFFYCQYERSKLAF
jgi:hypothetical protein